MGDGQSPEIASGPSNRHAAACSVGKAQAEMTVHRNPGKARMEPDPGGRLRPVVGPRFKTLSQVL